MAQRRPLGPQRFDEFKQRVRRFRPSDLLPALARRAAELEAAKLGLVDHAGGSRYARQFMVAGVAQVSLLWGNEFRDERALTVTDVDQLLELYFNLDDPAMHQDPSDGRLFGLLSRTMHEQGPAHSSPIDSMARMQRILITHHGRDQRAPTPSDWESILGVGLPAFAKICLRLYAAMLDHGGTIATADLGLPPIITGFAPLTTADVMGVADRFLIKDKDEYKLWFNDLHPKIQARLKADTYSRWAPNALQAAPIVRQGGRLVSPMVRYILDRAGTSGLYFIGRDAWSNRFADGLGKPFEGYVEEQLRLLGQAVNVIPEIEYAKGKQTVDLFLVTSEVLVLVEVKANRPIWEARIGEPEGLMDFEKKIGTAQDQIIATSRLLDEKHPSLANLPSGLPRRGLIVTLEPFYGLQTTAYEQVFGATPFPIAVASAEEFERVVGALVGRTDIGLRLARALTITEDHQFPVLSQAADGLDPGPNSILDAECERIDGLRSD